MKVNEIAAAIHADMTLDERNGYSWEERHGYVEEKELWFDGRLYAYKLGDRDCSSSTIEAWSLALKYTPYEGVLDGASYTGNMRSVFYNSGLFDIWDTNSTSADTGDLYLNDANHVAMCQDPVSDTLSEFSWGDNGAYGNQRGDQSGWESHITGFYDYPWNVTLHYNGKADTNTQIGWIYGDSVHSDRWWYRYSDGTWAADKWEKIDGEWYLFDADGYMLSGWQQREGEWYYLQPQTAKTGTHFGYMLTGWQDIKWRGKTCRFYFKKKDPKSGMMLRDGFHKIGGKWYAFDSNGVLCKKVTCDPKTGAVSY